MNTSSIEQLLYLFCFASWNAHPAPKFGTYPIGMTVCTITRSHKNFHRNTKSLSSVDHLFGLRGKYCMYMHKQINCASYVHDKLNQQHEGKQSSHSSSLLRAFLHARVARMKCSTTKLTGPHFTAIMFPPDCKVQQEEDSHQMCFLKLLSPDYWGQLPFFLCTL